MTFEIKIEKPNQKDIEQIAQIERGAFKRPYSPSKSLYIKQDKTSYNLVAKIDDEVIGYATTSLMWHGKMHLLDIAVKEGHRRKGVAQSLLSELIDYAKLKKLKEIYAEVSALNTSAINLYRKFGFRIKFGFRMPGDDEDVYNMTLYI